MKADYIDVARAVKALKLLGRGDKEILCVIGWYEA